MIKPGARYRQGTDFAQVSGWAGLLLLLVSYTTGSTSAIEVARNRTARCGRFTSIFAIMAPHLCEPRVCGSPVLGWPGRQAVGLPVPQRRDSTRRRAKAPRRGVRERTTIVRLIMRPRADNRAGVILRPRRGSCRRAILMGNRVVADLAIAIECLSGNRAGPEVQDRHHALLIPCVER
jgi:hypothetical protein